MKKITIFFLSIFCFLIISSCNNTNKDYRDSNQTTYGIYETNYDDEEYNIEEYNGYEDGTYSATVDYYNDNTGFSNTYTLDVEVEDNQVVAIYFPNGGYISAMEELDESGCCTVYEDGKTYEISID